MRQLWQYTHPQSLSYAFMQDPLLSQEVLLGWDHVARLKTALDQRPDDLVAFPVPRGPKARSYMPVLVGLGIPKNAPNPDGAKALIRHLVKLGAQAADPLADGLLPGRRRSALQADLARAARRGGRRRKTAAGEGRGPGAAPDRHRRGGRELQQVYRDTFTRIVRNGEDIQEVLNEQGELLDQIFAKTNAPVLGARSAERESAVQGRVGHVGSDESDDDGRRGDAAGASDDGGGRVCRTG